MKHLDLIMFALLTLILAGGAHTLASMPTQSEIQAVIVSIQNEGHVGPKSVMSDARMIASVSNVSASATK